MQDRQVDARSEASEEEEIKEIKDAVAEAIYDTEAHATNEEVIHQASEAQRLWRHR